MLTQEERLVIINNMSWDLGPLASFLLADPEMDFLTVARILIREQARCQWPIQLAMKPFASQTGAEMKH